MTGPWRRKKIGERMRLEKVRSVTLLALGSLGGFEATKQIQISDWHGN